MRLIICLLPNFFFFRCVYFPANSSPRFTSLGTVVQIISVFDERMYCFSFVLQQQGENEEILSCDVCGITYKFMSSLTRHMVTTHMNPEKMRQQAEEQRRKRENNYRKYLENRKMYETQHTTYNPKRNYHTSRLLTGNNNDDTA